MAADPRRYSVGFPGASAPGGLHRILLRFDRTDVCGARKLSPRCLHSDWSSLQRGLARRSQVSLETRVDSPQFAVIDLATQPALALVFEGREPLFQLSDGGGWSLDFRCEDAAICSKPRRHRGSSRLMRRCLACGARRRGEGR